MKKFDRGYIYYSLIASIGSAFVVVLMFSELFLEEELPGSEVWWIAGGIFLVSYLARVIYSILYVGSSGYQLTDDEVRCRRGVLFRKSSVLSYGKIHAVNKKQNLIHRIFGIAVLTVDSGATGNAFGAEITVIEKADQVDCLMALLKRRQEGLPVEETVIPEPVQQENLYSFSSRLKWIYSALHAAASVCILLVLTAAALVAAAVAAAILRSSPGFSAMELWLGVLFLSVLAMVLVSAVSLIHGIVTSFLRYHGFQVYRNRRELEIRYGLLVRHTNTFQFRRIKAVKIMEGPVKRLFGFASAGLEVVGYGSDSSSDDTQQNQTAAPGLLLPLCRADSLDATLGRILPDYVPEPIRHRAKSYWAFFLWPAFWTGLGYGIAFLVALSVLLLLELAPLAGLALGVFATAAAVHLAVLALVSYLRYRNAGLAIGAEKLTLQSGAFVRRRTVIRWKDIIGIEAITTPCRARKGICTYRIHFFANALTNTEEVQNLDAMLLEGLNGSLRQ